MDEELETGSQSRTDDGVPVGDADVQADIDRAGGGGSEPDRDEFLQEGAVEGSSDQGVPVGDADVEADRQRASGRDS